MIGDLVEPGSSSQITSSFAICFLERNVSLSTVGTAFRARALVSIQLVSNLQRSLRDPYLLLQRASMAPRIEKSNLSKMANTTSAILAPAIAPWEDGCQDLKKRLSPPVK
jgi:hypothetical protein